MTRSTFQRVALAAIAVCLIALISPRIVGADRDHVEIEFGRSGHDGPKSHQASHSSNTRDEVFLDESFSVTSGGTLAVELASTDVIVQAGSSSSQARVVIRGDGRDATEEFARRRFSVDYSASTLDVSADPERGRRSGRVDASFTVEITIPPRTDADVTVASGDVRLDNLVGYLEIASASGDIKIGSVQGPSISISAASGDISADQLDGSVSISTASGDIEVQRIVGSSAALNSASGDIYVGAAEVDQIQANSASGDVDIDRLIGQADVNTTSGDVSLHLADAADISTTSGTVSLRLPNGAGFDVDLQSPDIEIDSDLRFSGSRQDRRAQGTLGSGGARLEISTTSGSIELD